MASLLHFLPTLPNSITVEGMLLSVYIITQLIETLLRMFYFVSFVNKAFGNIKNYCSKEIIQEFYHS